MPWDRAGLALGINVTDGDAQAANRASIVTTVTLSTAQQPPDRTFELYGPGDVVGLAPGAVVRTDPPNGSEAHEPTRFVLAEFADPTTPWAFTPTAPTSAQRLRPWITLVVVAQRDGVSLQAGPGGQPDVLRVADPAVPKDELPDPATAWAWAHAQLAGTPTTDKDIEEALMTPGMVVSRLVCGRQLQPDTAYLACVVPTFAVGAQAGLGQAVDPAAKLAPAWDLTATEVTLPVYYSWPFRTGAAGDFLTLALMLRGLPTPDGMGEQLLDLSQVAGDGVTLTVGGALQRPGSMPAVVPPAVRDYLADAVSVTADGDVRPPLYGSAYAGVSAVDANASGWLAELNVDPAARVAAGLGAAVVRHQQDALVAGAWDQAGDAAAANQLVDRASLSAQVAERIFDRHLSPLPGVSLMQATAPGHDKTLIDAPQSTPAVQSVGAALRDAAQGAGAPAAVYSPAYTRLAARPAVRRGSVSSAPSATLDGRLTANLLTALDPSATVPRHALARVRAPAVATGSNRYGSAPVIDAAASATGAADGTVTDPLAPALFAPSFSAPQSAALAQLDPSFLLPGAQSLPANAVTLLEANPRFVSAFMVGANSELGRELAWQGFPVDRRATFLQTFWDSGGQTEGLDIAPIAGWASGAQLADGTVGDAASAGLTLVVRADLLRRYPTALIYALRAARDPGGALQVTDQADPTNVLAPVFSGTIAPDIRFLGFALSTAEAHSSADDPGWYFVFQEQPVETRFGTDSADPYVPSGTSATVAQQTLRPAALVAVHADDLLA